MTAPQRCLARNGRADPLRYGGCYEQRMRGRGELLQAFLMPPDVRDWPSEGHLAWCVLDAVEAVDLSAFDAAYREDGRCRPAYEPSMIVRLLLYAYSRGARSARAIERACEEDVAHRVVAAGQRQSRRHARLPALYALTDREVQVLALARAGDTNSEIAATLRVAPETVKKHLDHVYRKLGVDGRAAATGRALSLGLV
jgi:DNA-binding CsgD family transcriptional regulator